MTRTEYFKKQKELSQAAAHAEAESIRRIRAATRELVIPLVKQYAEQGMITYPKEELARQIDHIIREEGAKPVMAARKLQEDMEASLAEKLGILIKQRNYFENTKQKNDRTPRKPIGETIILPGRGWGYGMSSKGMAGYYRDPQTGKIVWTDLPLEYQFRKRADLSSQVWKAVEEQEQMVLDVVQGGRALGRNVKDIAGDLETFINYPNGGEKVVGRWKGMFPDTEEGRKEAWKRQYLAEHGGLQPGSDAAKALLKQPDAKDWVSQKMSETTKRGTPRLPAAVKQYASRLGKAGLDYRAIRIARTEMASMLSDEQKDIAKNSAISDGMMDWVMEKGRDAQSCRCEHLAAGGPYDVNNLVDDEGNDIDCPLHPNCGCVLRPHLKTDEEIMAAFKEEMAEELGIIEGTQEQKDMLEAIHDGLCPYCGRAFNSKMKNAECPICGKDMGDDNLKTTDSNFNVVTEEIKNKLQEQSNSLYSGFTPAQKGSIDNYSDTGYTEINNDLFSGKIKSPEIESHIKNLDGIMNSATVQNDLIVFRGTEAKHYINWNINEVHEYKSFMSTSVSKDIAVKEFLSNYSNEMLLEVMVPEGTRGLYLGTNSASDDEEELLLNRGMKYKVLEKTEHYMKLLLVQ